MLSRRRIFALFTAAVVAVAASPAVAATPPKPFDQKVFDASVAAGGPVVVHVSAPWCPICRAQKPVLQALRDEPRFRDFELYVIDFDNDKASVRAVGARLQSTLIIYRGGKEIARTVADREKGWIEELLEKAL